MGFVCTCVQVLAAAEDRGIGFPGTGATGDCETPEVCTFLDSDRL